MTSTSTVKQLALPPHYAVGNAQLADYHSKDAFALQSAAQDWRKANKIEPVGSDRKRVHLLVIDPQYDFSFPDGSLFVGGRSGTGAMDDCARVAEFIYRYAALISEVTCTMDSHLPYQVFYPSAHLLSDGSHPAPFTMVSFGDYKSGKYQANPAMATQLGVDQAWLQRQFTYYCQQLEQSGKYALTLWSYHCLIGSHGHKMAGVVDEARLFHAFLRGATNAPEVKGLSPLTENYSIFAPEVTTTWDGRAIPGAQKNTRLIDTLLNSGVVIMCGEAASHCLAWTIQDLLDHILISDPELAKKVYIMADCTSPVVIPGVVDYTDDAQKAFDKFQNAGMHLVNSTDPIETWPGISL